MKYITINRLVILLLLVMVAFMPGRAFAEFQVGVGVIGKKAVDNRCRSHCDSISFKNDQDRTNMALTLGIFKKTGVVDFGGEAILSDNDKLVLFTLRKRLGKWAVLGSVGLARDKNQANDAADFHGAVLDKDQHTGTVVGFGVTREFKRSVLFAKFLRINSRSDLVTESESHDYEKKDMDKHSGGTEIDVRTNMVVIGANWVF